MRECSSTQLSKEYHSANSRGRNFKQVRLLLTYDTKVLNYTMKILTRKWIYPSNKHCKSQVAYLWTLRLILRSWLHTILIHLNNLVLRCNECSLTNNEYDSQYCNFSCGIMQKSTICKTTDLVSDVNVQFWIEINLVPYLQDFCDALKEIAELHRAVVVEMNPFRWDHRSPL